MKLLAGDYLPDLPDYGSPGLSLAQNAYPGSEGYRPVGAFYAHADALPLPCKGAAAFIAPSGRTVLLAGTAASLYRLDGTEWVEVGAGYTLTDDQRWRFVQFGELAIVTNGVANPLKVNLETDAVASLGGSPPTMEALAVVGNFVVGTQIGGVVNRIAWSGENNAEWWTYAQRKSDFNDFPDGGEVTGIIGGDVGLVLQRSAVRRMAYIGGNVLFRFDKISSLVGCATVHSVAQHGELAFWYSDNGFKMWDGAQIRSIGHERVDNSFASLYGQINYKQISTAIDGQRNSVAWSTGNKIWLYNWLLDKWSIIDHAAEIVTQRATRPPSLEEQDTAEGAPDDDMDALGLDSLDAARFHQGDPVFYVFSQGLIGTFNGTNMEARFGDRTRELIEGRDARVIKVRPLVNAIGGVTVRMEGSQRLGDAPRRKDSSTLNASGEMPVRQRGRYMKSRVTLAAGEEWTYFRGLDVTLGAGGRR